jgi:hypothetical protein
MAGGGMATPIASVYRHERLKFRSFERSCMRDIG